MPELIVPLNTSFGYMSPLVFDNLPSQVEQIAALNAKVNLMIIAINTLNGV